MNTESQSDMVTDADPFSSPTAVNDELTESLDVDRPTVTTDDVRRAPLKQLSIKRQSTMGCLPVSTTTLLNLIELKNYTGESRVPDNMEEHFGTLVSRWPPNSSDEAGSKEQEEMMDHCVFERRRVEDADGKRVRGNCRGTVL